ncbi:hypothetical protein LEP1GSC008_1318 [Leptospira kirschneri serovar Bulgarica str. Nikolaevo]|uniref:Uncharacterized protein n=1 Tax=Leptospira kirschneri serovar Bulgarica str. Nikolaevo TaxID=1240687 RepID=M6FPE2_9LEPT|nr:hypothetical protein LEP1GSC008_1318 [Leptospira kirschneri serovar Bulgarica str. Nikolaevo]
MATLKVWSMDVALNTGVFKLGTTTGGAYKGLKIEEKRQ